MTTPVLERPMLLELPISLPHPCEEKRMHAHPVQSNWLSRAIRRSYISSYNFCLSELGWVPQRILEVGCGDGSLLSYVAQTFMNAETVIGVEFDPAKVEAAQDQNCCKIEFVALDHAESLPFEDGDFDLVVSHGLLGSTPLPRHWVSEMVRVSAEGVIMSAPTPLGLKWLSRLPGANKVQLIGNPVFGGNQEPVEMNTLKWWLDRQGLKTEAKMTPLPYGMLLARKPVAG